MSQPDLATAIGISQPSMSDIESGKTKSPSAINLLRIAAVLEADPWWLVSGEGDARPALDVQASEMARLFRELDSGKRRAILAAAQAIKDEDPPVLRLTHKPD